MDSIKKGKLLSEHQLKFAMLEKADQVLFLMLLDNTRSLQEWIDNIEDPKSFLNVLNEFILRTKSKRDSLKLIVKAEEVEPGFISLDSSALKNNKIVIRRAKELKRRLEQTESAVSIKTMEGDVKLSIPQIALIFVYEGKKVTRKNADELAKHYGHKSGEALFQDYTKYSSRQNRVGKPSPATPTKFKNKITLFESVIEKLTDHAKPSAQDDLKTLKTLFRDSDL